MGHNQYESPFCTRYASEEMQYIFSADHKFKTWRKLWIALAKAEQKQGLPITDAQISQLEQFAEEINYDVAIAREKEVRHDVMSHVYAYGVQCPDAKGIIHLGATSCYVGDNTDVIIMRADRPPQAAQRDLAAFGVCDEISGDAYLGVHPSSASPAYDSRQARNPLDERTADGP